MVEDAERLVQLYADALAEDGIGGHFCLLMHGDAETPVLGDRPDLIRDDADRIIIDCGAPFTPKTRMLLARPSIALSPEATARVRGYAELYGARALALRELADDVATECGLTLRQRYVLGRRLAGLAPVDIAAEAGLSVATVSRTEEIAVARLGAPDLAQAIAFAARRGWLAVTSLQNCSSTLAESPYKVLKNG